MLGISTDSVKKHEKFKSKYELPQTLLSDPDHGIAAQYGVWGLKKFMGREYEGVHRTTFLIDENGVIKQIWRDVKPEGHADEILAALRSE